jgi:hypothetical protein
MIENSFDRAQENKILIQCCLFTGRNLTKFKKDKFSNISQGNPIKNSNTYLAFIVSDRGRANQQNEENLQNIF